MKRFFTALTFCCASAIAWAQYTIYPVPQKMTAQEGTASFTEQVSIVCDEDIDQPTKDRVQQVLTEHGLTGNMVSSAAAGNSVIYLKTDPTVAVNKKFDAHNITLANVDGRAYLTITGQNTDATFMGLASLEQMLDAKGTSDLPCVTINDYADQLQRGIVEGYYGYPYSIEVKKDLMRFMMRMKMNSYMYGAKSDPYHHSRWTEPYPTSITPEQQKNGWLTQDMVREICEMSAATKVNFIWAIHPGNSFINSASVVNDIMAKYQKMYNLGVRQFGVFVDDVGVPSSDADLATNAQRLTDLQHAIEERWNAEGAAPADTVKPLNFVPQIYCRAFASSLDQYQRFFRALAKTPKHIIIYTTGYGVWSVPNAGDFNMPKEYLERDVAWWWNYPCNDNADAQIYPMDMYQNFVDMPAVGNNNRLAADMNAGIGIVSNPMQQGEVAKIPLFSVADYAWNNAKFDNASSWEASFPFILRNETKAQALRTLAPYLTKNDPNSKFPASTEKRTRENIASLLDAIAVVKDFANSSVESDQLLWRDLSPWVLKLEYMLQAANYYLDAKSGTEREDRWMSYVEGATRADALESKEDFIAYTLEGMNATVGSPHVAEPSQKYLRAYVNTLRNSAVKDLFPTPQSKVTKFTNTTFTITIKEDAQDVYIALAARMFKPGDYVGIALPNPERLENLLAADTLVQNHAVLISADGQQWEQLTPNGTDTNTPEGFVKYLIVANNSSQSTPIKLNSNVLKLTKITEPTLTSITAPVEEDWQKREYLYDGDVSTAWAPKRNQVTGDIVRLNLSAAAPIRSVRLVLHNTNGDIMKTGRVEISQKETTGYAKLAPFGSTKTSFTQSDMTPLKTNGTPYAAGEDKSTAYIYELIFNGKGQRAQYIRFYNQSATTNKWVRFGEFTVTYDIASSPCINNPEVCDATPYTCAFIKAGESLVFDPQTAYEVQLLEVYTDKGIKTIAPDQAGPITIPFDTDTRVYEVAMTTSSERPDLSPWISTGIQSVTPATRATDAPCYDLTGRRIQKGTKGIYIQNGKKFVR